MYCHRNVATFQITSIIMDAACSSETFTHTRLTTAPHTPKNRYLNSHPFEYLICHYTTFIGTAVKHHKCYYSTSNSTAVSTSNVTTLYVQILVSASSANSAVFDMKH